MMIQRLSTSSKSLRLKHINVNPRIIFAFLIFFGLASQSCLASNENNAQIKEANNLITQMIVEVEAILAQDISNDVARTKKVTALFDRYFDLQNIAKFSAGPYWRAADSKQKAEYTMAVRNVIIGTVVRNFDQLSGLKFIASSSQAKGARLVLVKGTFTDLKKQQPPIAVGWRVVTRNDSDPLIMDVEIENISMLVTQKQENIAIIRKNEGKFSALIEAMKQRSQSQ